MKDSLTARATSGGENVGPREAVEKLFSEDQDYKMKLASQYDMLSYVGSDIDEVRMDHLTFFKIFHSLGQLESKIRYDQVVELDTAQKSLLMPLGRNNDNLLGQSTLERNIGVLKTLADSEQFREDFKLLVSESLL